MNRKVKLVNPNEYIYFENIHDDGKYYCISKEEHKKHRNIFEFSNGPYDVDDSITVSAYELIKIHQDYQYDYYDVCTSSNIIVQVNQIRWLFTYSYPS